MIWCAQFRDAIKFIHDEGGVRRSYRKDVSHFYHLYPSISHLTSIHEYLNSNARLYQIDLAPIENIKAYFFSFRIIGHSIYFTRQIHRRC